MSRVGRCPYLKHLLVYFSFFPTFLGYISILVVVEAVRLSVLEIIVRLSNVDGLFLPFICYSYSYVIILFFFC